MSGPRELLIELYDAAIGGADVESLTTKALAAFSLERRQRVWVFAFGKAAHHMATAAVAVLQRSLAEIAGGLVVAHEDGEAPCGTVPVMVGDHPVPGRRSVAAATRVAQLIAQKRGTDLGIVLVSGGTSSLIGAPLRGMGDADLSLLYELLLGSGLDIHEMNVVRKRFALLAAGRMAVAMAPARTICLAVSDVPGDDLASIGSGPCVPDPARVQHVVEALQRSNLYGRISQSFRQYLLDVARGVIAETPKASHPAFAHVTARVIANNAVALDAAAVSARRSGFTTMVHDGQLVGDTTSAAATVAAALLKVRAGAAPGSTHCWIWGGETTVFLNGGSPAGGRCQELALAVAQRLHEAGPQARGITLLAAGTDGRDGRTDAAGAVVDEGTWAAISASGRDPAAALRAHASHDALAAASALFSPGTTGTNVMDVTIGLVRA